MNAPNEIRVPGPACVEYAGRLQSVLQTADWRPVDQLARALLACWTDNRQLFLCGNGGSAANAVHLANDFLFGIGRRAGVEGMRVQALPANTAIVTCLANDINYSEIFSAQLSVYAKPGDVLIALSGSGNSPNILKALEKANGLGMRTFAILGYSGGKAKDLAQVPIHFPIDDMQISEDLQSVVGHILMQWLCEHAPGKGRQFVK